MIWEIVKAAGVPTLLLGVIITSWVQIKSSDSLRLWRISTRSSMTTSERLGS